MSKAPYIRTTTTELKPEIESEVTRRAEMQAERSSTQAKKASAAPRSVQKFSAVKPAAAPRSNTNRPGSAMSLRAGARRGLGGSGKR